MKRKAGFTLVEVIVALAIFAIIVVMVFPLFGFYSKVNNIAEKKMDAQEIAVELTENVHFSVANGVIDKSALINSLSTPALYGSGAFLRRDDNTYFMTKPTYTAELTFHNSNQIIKIKIVTTKDNQSYETMGWIAYAQP